MKPIIRIAIAILFGLCFSTCKADLIVNGGFEQPAVGPGGVDSGYKEFTVGQTIGAGWVVVGTGNDVTVGPGTETQAGGGTYTVEEGLQALDLTGDFDNGSHIGVQQTVSTDIGTQYSLSFYVGHFDPADGGGPDASLILDINGTPVLTATNSGVSAGEDNWELFTYDFTATETTTTLAFFNNTPAGAFYGGLDNVQLNEISAVATPEPSSLALFGSALLASALLRRKMATIFK